MPTEEDAIVRLVENRLSGITNSYGDDGDPGFVCSGPCHETANEEPPLSEDDISIIMTGACSSCWGRTIP